MSSGVDRWVWALAAILLLLLLLLMLLLLLPMSTLSLSYSSSSLSMTMIIFANRCRWQLLLFLLTRFLYSRIRPIILLSSSSLSSVLRHFSVSGCSCGGTCLKVCRCISTPPNLFFRLPSLFMITVSLWWWRWFREGYFHPTSTNVISKPPTAAGWGLVTTMTLTLWRM